MGRLNLDGFLYRSSRILLVLFYLLSTLPSAQAGSNIDNIRLNGNTISTLNTNGNLTFDLNGSGGLILTDLSANTVPYLDASKKLTSSGVSQTTLSYLDIASSLTGLLAGKQATGNYITALTGDVTATGPGSVAATIANNVVTNAKLATVASGTFKGRTTASTGNVEDLTATQATAMLNVMVGDSGSGGTKGLAPAPGSGDSAANKFLKADGTWSTTPSASAAPAGMIIAYAGTSCPVGYLAADGTEASRTTYSVLYSAIGVNFGVGDGSTTFNVPDLRYKFLRGYGGGSAATGTGTLGTKAGFTGTLAGAGSSVTYTARKVGVAGNSISITFNGSTTIAAAISTWNLAHTSNRFTATGTLTQTPSNGATLTLSGGVDAIAAPPVAAIAATADQIWTGAAAFVVLTASTAGTGGNSITLTGNGTSTIAQLITAWNGSNPGNQVTLTVGTSSQIPSNGATITLYDGEAINSDATFTSHGILRTGQKVRLTSGTLTGLSADTDYWAIVINSNKLAFATTYQNALISTKIAISGANSAVITPWDDPDAGTRVGQASGANTGANVGSIQDDAFQGHTHTYNRQTNTAGGGGGGRLDQGTGNNTGAPGDLATYGTARVATETRPSNVYVLFCIKI